MATAPGISHWVPIPYGEFGRFVRDPLGFQLSLRERFGDVARFRIGPMLVYFVFHPDHVRHILHDHQKNYLRGWQYRILKNLFGANILTSEGSYWLRQRRLAQPAFHRNRLANYASAMIDAAYELTDRWRTIKEPIDVGPEMSKLALAIAGRTFFDCDVTHAAGNIANAFVEMAAYLEKRFNRMFTTPPAWVPTPGNRRFNAAAKSLKELVDGLIRERRREGRDHGDLLSMLMQARDDETGEVMTDDQVRSEVLTFLLAGHETTATALTWTWHLLGTHADARKRVREEIATVLNGRRPTVADVSQLILTRAAIEESMRLYPPIWAVPRQAVADDEIGGYRIPAGSSVCLCPYVTHHHPDCWPRPEEFDLDRFLPAQVADRPKGMYFPFLSGPHLCIGNEFAMMEMILIVAIVLQQFELEAPSGPPIRPKVSIALRPGEPIRVKLTSSAIPNSSPDTLSR